MMATSSKIKIMISSRCKDRFPLSDTAARDLSEIRKQLKSEIESLRVFGRAIYEVWINELETEDAAKDAWEHCLDQAKECDIFIALFNGNAGWPGGVSTFGICFAEYMAAVNVAPGKVFTVNIFEQDRPDHPCADSDRAFQIYVTKHARFDARATTDAELIDAVKRTVAEATVRLAQRGVRDASRGTGYVGPALDWSRQNYGDRAESMKSAALSAMGEQTRRIGLHPFVVVRPLEGARLLFHVNAIPDTLSVPAAREIVGQPHLQDHLLLSELKSLQGGPIHLVACHKGATESQAVRMLGFPNATVVSAPFGIYVVDPVQSIQLVLIAQCRDETTTRHGVQRFFEWLYESEQAAELIRHAGKRKGVVKALAGS